MDYTKISKNTVGYLYEGYKSLNESPLSPHLRVLIELYISQINGCDYCCNIHKNEAVKLDINKDKIENLSKFSQGNLFNDSEIEALAWAESLTKLNGTTKVHNTNLSKYFSEREIVDITICISLMNALNRLAMSMRNEL